MAYVDPRLQGKPAPTTSVAKMESEHIARLDRVKGSDIAFLDRRIPAYRREIINIIGMGVTENVKDPDLAPKIKAPAHGFAIAYARGPKGCGAALHRHPTEEVFLTLKGKWEIYGSKARMSAQSSSNPAISSMFRLASTAASAMRAMIRIRPWSLSSVGRTPGKSIGIPV